MSTVYSDDAGTNTSIIGDSGVVDPQNSSTSNLTVGASFVGGTTVSPNFTAIQYILKTDQNCTIYVDQSSDGTNWDISDKYDFYVSEAGNGNTVQLVSSYYRIRVINIGVATTTFFRLRTVTVPMLATLPRSLNQNGNLKVSIYDGITDGYGFESYNSPYGELVSVPLYRLIGGNFSTAVDTNFWTPSTGTGGSVTVANSSCNMATGTTANNLVSLQSVHSARMTGGQTNRFHTYVHLADGGVTLNNTRRGGIFDANNGAFFEVSNGVFSVVVRNNGVDTKVSNGNFNGDLGSTVSLGNKVAHFDILYGPSTVWFVMERHIVHRVDANATTWTSSFNLPIRFENFNTGGSTTNVTMDIIDANVTKLGIPQTQPVGYFQQGLTAGQNVKLGPGNVHGLVLSGITNNAVVSLYDNTTATGKLIWSSGTLTSNGLPFYIDFKGIAFSTGLSVAITGAACNAMVMYE